MTKTGPPHDRPRPSLATALLWVALAALALGLIREATRPVGQRLTRGERIAAGVIARRASS